MNIFLIENDRTIDLIKRMPSYREGVDTIVCLNYLPFVRLRSEGGAHKFYFVEEFFSTGDYDALHSASDHFALNWYRRDGEDLSSHGGISYGDITKITFSRTYMVTVLLKYGELINKAVARWPEAGKIFYDLSVSSTSFVHYADDEGRFFNKHRLVEQVCKQLKREPVQITPEIVIPSLRIAIKHARGRKSLAHRMKDACKALLIKTNSLVKANGNHGENVYFFSYFNINAILEHMKDNFIVSGSDSNILNPRRFFNSRFLQIDDVKYEPSDDEKQFLKSFAGNYPPEPSVSIPKSFFVFNGIDYSFLYYPVIRDIVLNVIPGLLKYAGKVKKAIKRFRISNIIVNEEIDERFQVVIAACKAAGIKSTWVDHGIQGGNFAQKVCARGKSEQIICAGDFYAGHYRAQSNGASTCIALGNPSLDLYGGRVKSVTSIKNVMFLGFEDSFYSRLDRFVYLEKYYEEIFSIFGELKSMGIKIYFKPHPGDKKEFFDYLLDFFKIDPTEVTYIKDVPYSKVVYDMDLVVCSVTSCFYESQAAGVPTIFLDPHFIPEALLPPLNGVNGEEVLRVSSGKEVLSIIKENLDNPEKLKHFLKKFHEKYSARYMGKLDGMAGKRIVEYLKKDI